MSTFEAPWSVRPRPNGPPGPPSERPCIQDVIISHVCIPTVLPPVTIYDNSNAFTFAMRHSLAQCINLQRIPLRPANYTGCRVSATRYYDFMRTNVRDRFNFRIVPITGDGNCFFRTLSHIIFGDESEHHNIRGSLMLSVASKAIMQLLFSNTLVI